MNVTEALRIVQRAPRERLEFSAFLACGFTPLHLQLLLTAHLQEKLTQRKVRMQTGLYGDLAGSLESLGRLSIDAVACAIEWPDLDPRFSYRESGSWDLSAVRDIVAGIDHALNRIRAAIEQISDGVRVAVSLPTLPFPPLFHTVGWQASEAELIVDQRVAHFASELIRHRGTSVVNVRRLSEESAPAMRLDIKADLAAGFPYSLLHADALASSFSRLLVPGAPKKGIITDLDNTLWHGIVGDLGPAGVSWDLASHHQIHGLYQKVLSSLADAGILIAVASKNDLATVAKAFDRNDILLPTSRIYPLEVHWNAKSGSVKRILETWNIGADAVIFVDDSPMEIAEVQASHPDLTCMHFPTDQPQAALHLLRTLRDLCGKERVSEEDSLRLESIRRGTAFRNEASQGSAGVAAPDAFLEAASAQLTVNFDAGTEDFRALELVNKTNQFNINGLRHSEAEWKSKLIRNGAMHMVVSYTDKFGPLGKIGVVQGRVDGRVLVVDTWVLSCRAFARRIEHQCLKLLFERFNVEEIEIHFLQTAKNGPARDFFAEFLGVPPTGRFRLTPALVIEKCPPLYHHINEIESVQSNG